MLGPLSICLILLATVYVGVIVHEAGHALIGKAIGFVVTSVGLGIAGPFLILPIGRARLYFGLIRPLQGLTFAFLPRPGTDRWRLAVFMAGGIAANALCAAASLGLAFSPPTRRFAAFLCLFAVINAILAVSSLMPVRIRVGGAILRSDGMLLLELLRRGSPTTPSDVIQNARGCRRLWRAVGDGMMDRLHTLSAALTWIGLGSPSRAEALLSEAVAIDGPHPYIDWLEAVTRAELALARGEPSEASAALVRAESHGDAAGTEGRYLLSMQRASLLVGEGKQGEALAAFERLSDDPVGRKHPELGLSALIGHLGAACAAGDQAVVSALLARYEVARLDFPSDTRDLHAYGASARFASSRGVDARDDSRRALKAAAALAASWHDPEDRAAFIDARRELIEEARKALGDEEAGSLLAAVETHRPDDALPDQDESWRRRALRLMSINVISFVPLVLTAFALRPRGTTIAILAMLLAVFTILGAVFLILDVAVRKLFPSLKRLSGVILLILAVTPWLGGLIFGAVISSWMP